MGKDGSMSYVKLGIFKAKNIMVHIWALKSAPWPWRRFFTNLIYTWCGVHGLTCILVSIVANSILRAHLGPQSA